MRNSPAIMCSSKLSNFASSIPILRQWFLALVCDICSRITRKYGSNPIIYKHKSYKLDAGYFEYGVKQGAYTKNVGYKGMQYWVILWQLFKIPSCVCMKGKFVTNISFATVRLVNHSWDRIKCLASGFIKIYIFSVSFTPVGV